MNAFSFQNMMMCVILFTSQLGNIDKYFEMMFDLKIIAFSLTLYMLLCNVYYDAV